MSYDPSSEGGQDWGGRQQPPPYPGGHGQQQPPPAGWGQAPAGPPPGYSAAYGTGPSIPPAAPGGLFGALFDYGFHSFATPAVIKVLYILGTVLIGLAYIGAVITGFAQGVGLGLAAVIGGALVALVYLIFLRITLEFYYAVVRMSEDIHQGRR